MLKKLLGPVIVFNLSCTAFADNVAILSDRGRCPPVEKYVAWNASSDGRSVVGIELEEGPALSVIAVSGTEMPGTQKQLKFQLEPNRLLVIGRQNGGTVPYLDKNYVPTPLLPGSNKPVADGSEEGLKVSRAHFSLRATAQGIVLTNGVPRLGGGIRAPRNPTKMLYPGSPRYMEDGEDYIIENGAIAKIRLANGSVLVISAIE